MAAPVPQKLRPIQHYLKTAQEHDKRDPVVAYYCRLYAVQMAMGIDKSSPDCRTFLVYLMDQLEKFKQEHSEEEGIQSETVGQAHMEAYALKLFIYADNEDRAGRFGKNVVKSFYTAGLLFDVITNFGELSEDIQKSRKYAKWKAAYIHKCLKEGTTPVAGPMGEDGEEGATGGLGFDGVSQPGPSSQPSVPSVNYPTDTNFSHPPSGSHAPPSTPSEPPAASVPQAHHPAAPAAAPQRWQPPANPAGVQLQPEDFTRAQKYCKYAGSALQYEDTKTAVDNLMKALNLLTTGHE